MWVICAAVNVVLNIIRGDFLENLIGKRFGRLLVLSETTLPKGKWNVKAYVCQCDCGNVKTIRRDGLISGHSTSCGCYRVEAARKATMTHGLSKGSKNHHPLYDVWSTMIQRCHNKNSKSYSSYGGRGISVCDEWRHNFQSFYDWSLKHGYQKGMSIDRINNDKGYYPENCRWVTQYTQSRNKRNNIIVTYLGQEMILQDVSNITHIPPSTLYYRYKHGKPIVITCGS